MVRVKICGITSKGDAWRAVDAGADALGFVFHRQSPRRISAEAAKAICRTLPPMIARVGVFVNEDLRTVRRIFANCRLNFAQMHGEETPQECSRLHIPFIRAIRVRYRGDLRKAALWRGARPALFLLDSFIPGVPGGTGRSFDWKMLCGAKFPAPFFLTGGLNPRNVRRAVGVARPYGVDVSTGVERAPGRKDANKMKLFVRAAKGIG